MKEYSVLQCLPDSGEKCLAYGHKTFCCKEDMEENPNWHEVIFEFILDRYKLKKEMPKDIEDSVLEYCHFTEFWKVNDGAETENHLIGVTKWRKL